jgi:hypothetical protein
MAISKKTLVHLWWYYKSSSMEPLVNDSLNKLKIDKIK